MEFLLVIILPLVLCAILVRNHLFAAMICVGMLLLCYLNMTVMLFTGAVMLLTVLVLVFLALFLVEIQWKRVKSRTTKSLLWALAIVRYPVNFIYLSDIVFRLQHWGPINDISRDQPSLGAGIGSMLEISLMMVLVISVILLILYIVQIKRQRRVETTNKDKV